MNEPFQTLIEAAVLAPSGDNTQPWRFEVDEQASTITVYLDPTRDTSPMNAGQHMARIGCGAAIENIVRMAQYNNWATDLDFRGPSPRVATVAISGIDGNCCKFDATLTQRHTNRRLYDCSHPCQATLSMLAASARSVKHAEILVLTDSNEKNELAQLIAEGDRLMFRIPGVLHAFLEKVRFDLPATTRAAEGLPLGALEISPLDRILLPWLKRVSKTFSGFTLPSRRFYNHALRLVTSSSGVVVISTATDSCEQDVCEQDIRIGMAMQKMWLLLHEHGFAVQPMMSIPVLDAMAQGLLLDAHKTAIRALCKRAALCLKLREHPVAAILRFGTALPASARTGRRTVDSTVVSEIGHEKSELRRPLSPELASL